MQVSDAPIAGSAGKLLLFQRPGETRLRAITWDASLSGTLPGEIRANAAWSQSPYGASYLVGDLVFDRDGHPVGPISWPSKIRPTWSPQGTSLCVALPEREVTGAAMRLEHLTLGQPARVVARGFATFSDNAAYPVLGCDEGTDRAIVAVFGQGIAPARLWVFRLSTGAVIRSVDYTGASVAWVAASSDGSMLAESERSGGPIPGGKSTATIRLADSGASLGTIEDIVVQGFSGDGTLVVGTAGVTTTTVIDWKSGRRVWSLTGPYGGFLSEPAGRRLAVGVGFVGGSDQRDVYLIQPDGSAPLLPAGVRIALLY